MVGDASLISPRNVIAELIDEHFLLGNDGFDDITDRNDADKFLLVEDGKMSHMFPRHQDHALLHGVSRFDLDKLRGHDFPDQRFSGGLAPEDNLSGINPVGR